MNKDIYKKAIVTMIQMKSLEVSDTYLDDLWGMIKEDFTDDEFKYACSEMVKHETLYNKQPDPKLFYKYRDQVRPKPVENDELLEAAKNRFVEKVGWYLSQSSLNSLEKKEFNQELSTEEHNALVGMGGISTLWSAVNSEEGYPRSRSSVLREVGERFKNSCKADDVTKRLEGSGLKQVSLSKMIGEM